MQKPKAHVAGQAGAQDNKGEIEITEEMIDEGYAHLQDYAVMPEGDSPSEVLKRIYRAMRRVERE